MNTNTDLKTSFLKDISNQNNHRHLLWDALEKTDGSVIEMGMGHGSTPYLSEYCKAKGRPLFSYETNLQWLKKFKNLECDLHSMRIVDDWDYVFATHPNPSVVLIDHAPGERRKFDIQNFMDRAVFIVAHDTEPAADHGYKMRQYIKKFKYYKDYKTEGAWASIMSMKEPV
jgi:hypothetical protein